MNKNLNKTVEVLKRGGIVIFPTDTAFGIGCRIDDVRAVERLFDIRKRPKEKAVPILASSIRMIEEYVRAFGPDVRKLMRRYWPGGLTLVLPANLEKVPSLIRGGGNTIGIRIPNQEDLLKVIYEVGVPILGPSANFPGGKTPFVMSDLDPDLVRQVDFVLPGRCKIKKPSTVLDVTKKPWKIIREGAVRLEL
mgnify:CR=1 FL=1